MKYTDQPFSHPLNRMEGEAFKRGGQPRHKKRAEGGALSSINSKEAPLRKLRAKPDEIYEGVPHREEGVRRRSFGGVMSKITGISSPGDVVRRGIAMYTGIPENVVKAGQQAVGLKRGGGARREKDEEVRAREGGQWIQEAINPAHKGALHKKLHVPMDEKIPSKRLVKAENSRNPGTRKQANLAMTLRKFHKHQGK